MSWFITTSITLRFEVKKSLSLEKNIEPNRAKGFTEWYIGLPLGCHSFSFHKKTSNVWKHFSAPRFLSSNIMVNLTYENNEKGWFALKWDGVDPGYEKLISSDRTPACLNDMRWMLCAVHMLGGGNKSGWNYLVICQIPTHHLSLS